MVTLSGANTYGGGTSINGGTLAVNGSLLSTGEVDVSNLGYLSGSGSAGNVIVHGGGTLAPGLIASAGTLNATTLQLQSGGVLSYTLGKAPAATVTSTSARA